MSNIKYFLMSDDSLVYTNNHRFKQISNEKCIEIDIEMLDRIIARMRYFYELDMLIIGDYTKTISKITKFSTINTEEAYFQQMTEQDCTMFEYTDVDEFMKKIKRMLDEA